MAKSKSKAAPKKRKLRQQETYLVVIRSWMLIVIFALMLGIGAIVGNFFRVQLQDSDAQVAGATIELR